MRARWHVVRTAESKWSQWMLEPDGKQHNLSTVLQRQPSRPMPTSAAETIHALAQYRGLEEQLHFVIVTLWT